MIKTFAHKGLQKFYKTGSKAGINAKHADRLSRQLARLDLVAVPNDMNLPGWSLHPRGGDLSGQRAVKVRGNWRLTFKFDGTDVVIVDYQDHL